LTARGHEIYDQAARLQAPWVNALSAGIEADDIVSATRTIQRLRERLEGQRNREPKIED
jgi:hypothetical protein